MPLTRPVFPTPALYRRTLLYSARQAGSAAAAAVKRETMEFRQREKDLIAILARGGSQPLKRGFIGRPFQPDMYDVRLSAPRRSSSSSLSDTASPLEVYRFAQASCANDHLRRRAVDEGKDDVLSASSSPTRDGAKRMLNCQVAI
jgi:hypothetical protein